jgi:hypothetical protein
MLALRRWLERDASEGYSSVASLQSLAGAPYSSSNFEWWLNFSSGLVEDDESTRRLGDIRMMRLAENDAKAGPSIVARFSVVGVEERGGNVSLTVLAQPPEVSRLKSEPSRRTRHQMPPSQCVLACKESFVVSR